MEPAAVPGRARLRRSIRADVHLAPATRFMAHAAMHQVTTTAVRHVGAHVTDAQHAAGPSLDGRARVAAPFLPIPTSEDPA
jgi:hypothetical protein